MKSPIPLNDNEGFRTGRCDFASLRAPTPPRAAKLALQKSEEPLPYGTKKPAPKPKAKPAPEVKWTEADSLTVGEIVRKALEGKERPYSKTDLLSAMVAVSQFIENRNAGLSTQKASQPGTPIRPATRKMISDWIAANCKGEASDDPNALTAAQLAMCKERGIDPERFAATRAAIRRQSKGR